MVTSTDIPGTGAIDQGNEVVQYLGGLPLKGELPSRMVALLFRQRFGKLDLDVDPIAANQYHEREPFDVNEFALQNHLQPRGLSFFTCVYDRTVAQRYEKLGFGEPQFISDRHVRRKAARKDRKDATKEATAKKWTWSSPTPKDQESFSAIKE